MGRIGRVRRSTKVWMRGRGGAPPECGVTPTGQPTDGLERRRRRLVAAYHTRPRRTLHTRLLLHDHRFTAWSPQSLDHTAARGPPVGDEAPPLATDPRQPAAARQRTRQVSAPSVVDSGTRSVAAILPTPGGHLQWMGNTKHEGAEEKAGGEGVPLRRAALAQGLRHPRRPPHGVPARLWPLRVRRGRLARPPPR